MFNLRKYILLLASILMIGNIQLYAHEPIYGNGPHVLFKGGFAPGITLQSGFGYTNTEFNLEYGLTTNLTIGTDVFLIGRSRGYAYEAVKIKGKYRFYTEFKKGSMLQFSALGGFKLAAGNNNLPDVINFGFAAGRESTTWYWFASAVYKGKFQNKTIDFGDEVNYDLTLGYRLTKLSYYKPDLVLFLEFIGNHAFRSKINGALMNNSGGDSWAVAPTLMFTYRNYALRAGVEIGIGESGFITRPNTNLRVSLEMHI